jgi:death on curing protein
MSGWLTVEFALSVHEEQLHDHGGKAGLRDLTLLESAIAKPQQLAAYAQPDVFELAAAYAFGVAKNHPFLDGNKRTAWVLARTYCLLNGFDFTGTDVEAVIAMLRLAAGDDDQDTFATFLRDNSAPAAVQ